LSAFDAPQWTLPHCSAFMRHQYPGLLEGDMQIFYGFIAGQGCLIDSS